jgi:hypothetical protein
MNFPYGPITTTPYEGFVPKEQWPEYHSVGIVPAHMHPILVGKAPQGKRWGLGPLVFEEYISDTPPDFAESDKQGSPTRIICWKRVSSTPIPAGWYKISMKPSHVEGVALLSVNAPYWKGWDESARRYRNKWLTQHNTQTHRIELVSFEEFTTQYQKSTVAPKAGNTQLSAISHLLSGENSKTHTALFGARHIASGVMQAGMAVVYSPTHHSSYYQAGFVLPEASKYPLMVGLMDHWHQEALTRNLQYLQFGGFWHPGLHAKTWKGFSSFKAKFNLQYIAYQPTLMRLRLGTRMVKR